MRFISIFTHEPTNHPPTEAEIATMGKLIEEGMKAGWLIATEGVHFGATGVRVHKSAGGKVTVTDGPFVETKEKVGGLFIIEARDLNEAIRIASMHPGARLGEDRGWAVEIRPIAGGCHQ